MLALRPCLAPSLAFLVAVCTACAPKTTQDTAASAPEETAAADQTPESDQAPTHSAVSDLADTSWQLVKIMSMDDTVETPEDSSQYTLEFDAEGTMRLRADCNRGTGPWSSESPGQLQFGLIAATQAICPPGSLHDRYIAQFEWVRSYVLEDGHLFLATMADGSIIEFEPLPGAPLAVTPEADPLLVAKLAELHDDIPGPIHYFATQYDLNGDGHSEWIVHVAGPMVCGTGGCNTIVLTQEAQQLRRVASISITRPPITVAESSTAGWRDLIVHVSGGGARAYDARLRFDGSTYPGNPSVEPAEPLENEVQGDVVIPTFESFTEGQLLRPGSE